jgi:hypothetical protein
MVTWAASKPTSLAEGNAPGKSVVSDLQQNLVNYSYTVTNGKRTVIAYRFLQPVNDPSDHTLDPAKPYYALLAEGDNLDVGYHGTSFDNAIICLTTLEQKVECKRATEWSGAPCIGGNCTSAPDDVGPIQQDPSTHTEVVTFTLKISGITAADMNADNKLFLREALATKLSIPAGVIAIARVTDGSAMIYFEIFSTPTGSGAIISSVNQLQSQPSHMQTLITDFRTKSSITAALTGTITTAATAGTVGSKCTNVNLGGATATWAVGVSTTRIKVTLDKAGWIGMGFQKEMVGGNIILGDISGSTPRARTIEFADKSGQANVNSQPDVSAASFAINNGQSELVFSYSGAVTGNTDVILAHGSSTNFGYHSSNKWQLKVNFQTCGSVEENPVVGWKVAHGTMMLFSWCVLVPIAVMAARFTKNTKCGSKELSLGPIKKANWLAIHLTANLMAVAICIAAAIIALKENDNQVASFDAPDTHSKSVAAHLLFGKVIAIGAAIQVIIGLARAHKHPEGPQPMIRTIWELVHKNYGRILSLFAIANCWLGMVAIDWQTHEYKVIFIIMWVVVLMFLVLALVAQVYQCAQKKATEKKERTSKNPDLSNDADLSSINDADLSSVVGQSSHAKTEG